MPKSEILEMLDELKELNIQVDRQSVTAYIVSQYTGIQRLQMIMELDINSDTTSKPWRLEFTNLLYVLDCAQTGRVINQVNQSKEENPHA